MYGSIEAIVPVPWPKPSSDHLQQMPYELRHLRARHSALVRLAEWHFSMYGFAHKDRVKDIQQLYEEIIRRFGNEALD